jgi:3-hydroxybutyryl-CoA dehydrogenase
LLLSDGATSDISRRLQAAIFRESLALVEAGVATPADIDLVITSAIGRRWAVGGPFEIWEQIGWDLVQVIAGELFKEISVATAPFDISHVDTHADSDLPVANGGRDSKANSPQFKNIAVVGAGLMGHGIALEFAIHGRQVILHDISEELLADAIAKVRVGLGALASVGRIAHEDIESALSRISTTTNLPDAVSDADLVIEAASENLDLKKKIFSEISNATPDHAVLASNSSTFVPSAYGSAANRPEQVVGIHYYNPPHLLPGVEIVRGPETADEVVELVASEYALIGKKTAVVKREIQGFVGNRLQVALLREAMSVIESGTATAAQVDEIVRDGFGKEFAENGVFGSLANEPASPTHLSLQEIFPLLNNDRELPRILLDKIASGDLGVKTGIGFYDWTPESADAWRANMADSLLHMGWE